MFLPSESATTLMAEERFHVARPVQGLVLLQPLLSGESLPALGTDEVLLVFVDFVNMSSHLATLLDEFATVTARHLIPVLAQDVLLEGAVVVEVDFITARTNEALVAVDFEVVELKVGQADEAPQLA